jgi:glycosyltransferase involved in cell wall biosynthesis
MRILFLMRDYFPPFRPDVAVLFGKCLARQGIASDLLVQTSASVPGAEWPAGRVFVRGVERRGMLGELVRPLQDLAALRLARQGYDLIQVRDKIRSALIGLLAARLAGLPFVYWMSAPFVESFASRQRDVGWSQGPLVWFGNTLRAWLSERVFYGFLITRADHIFVQSERMLEFMHERGVARERMTAVPMGVDTAVLNPASVCPAKDQRLRGRRVIVYLGVLGYARRSDFLLEVVRHVAMRHPDVLLVLAGDAPSPDERAWIRRRIDELGVSHHVWLTGWLAQRDALPLVKAAEVGLSPVPRGELYDISSPTKALEYLALGVPCVGNDIPDQEQVIESSGAGLCVPMEVVAFSAAICALLDDPQLARRMGARGPAFIAGERSYEILARRVARTYRVLAGGGTE